MPIQLALKRVFDITLAAILLVALCPVLLFIAWKVGRATGGSPFFFQLRPGWRGKPFRIVKFRTMLETRDEVGQLCPDEQRLTRTGRFLRSTSLDELPELWNVLKGDMSLVGPRPLLMEYLDRYTPEQARRHDVKPGITGWAQINGRNAISWEEKFKLDVWYVDNWSLWLDCKILIRTIRKTFQREGISASSHATMPEFMGTKKESQRN